MPRCEGRPGAVTCPDNRNDNTVRGTQGDLLLCPKCDDFRFGGEMKNKATSDATTNRVTATIETLGSDVTTKVDETKRGNVKGRTRNAKQPALEKSLKTGSDVDSAPQSQKCPKCSLSVLVGEGLLCDICASYLHTQCAGIKDSVVIALLTIVPTTGWVCAQCRTEVRIKIQMLQSSQARLVEEVSELKTDIQRLRTDFESYRLSHPEPPVIWPKESDESVVSRGLLAAVHMDLNDKKRRQQNVVVYGLKPVEGMSDADILCELFENCLSFKPRIKVDRCRRLGKPLPGKRQPLLVPLETADAATELLKCAPQLRGTVYGDVYINPDFTPAEAKAAYMERQKRRAYRTTISGETEGDGKPDLALQSVHQHEQARGTAHNGVDGVVFLNNNQLHPSASPLDPTVLSAKAPIFDPSF